MNRFFYGIGDFFETTVFPASEAVARGTNFIIVIAGSIATFAWIFWEMKNRNEPKQDH